MQRDIPDLGVKGLKIIPDIGERKEMLFDGCIGCGDCVEECPEDALVQEEDNSIVIDLALCDGVACGRCERACPEKVFDLIKLLTSEVKV